MGQTCRRYFSRYLGNKMANELSSSRGAAMYSGFHSSTAQWSTVPSSHGLSRRYLLWFFFSSPVPWGFAEALAASFMAASMLLPKRESVPLKKEHLWLAKETSVRHAMIDKGLQTQAVWEEIIEPHPSPSHTHTLSLSLSLSFFRSLSLTPQR